MITSNTSSDMRVCMCVCVRACVRVCVFVWVCPSIKKK